jgi:hypothetical protein
MGLHNSHDSRILIVLMKFFSLFGNIVCPRKEGIDLVPYRVKQQRRDPIVFQP